MSSPSQPAPVDPADTAALRAFNRFYTQRIGVLAPYLGGSLSLTEVRVLYEIAERTGLTAATLARELRFELPHALGSVPQVRNPLRFSATPIEYQRAPPMLGEHSAELLRERLGLTDAEIAKLVDDGVIGVR